MDEITKHAIEDVEKDIKKELIGDLEALKKSAKNFLNVIKYQIIFSEEMKAEIEKNNLYDINTIYEAMHKETSLAQSLVAEQFIFEKAINNFLGRTIALIWIDDKSGEIYYVDEATAEKIYATGTRKENGRVSISGVSPEKFGVSSEKFNASFKDFIDKLGDFGTRIKQHQKNYAAIYEEVKTRWNNNTQPNPPDNKWYNIGKERVDKNNETKKIYLYRTTFYWQGPGGQAPGDPYLGWSHSKKMNLGNISEAYVNILMNSDEAVATIPTGVSEDSVKQYWFYMKNHKILNNTSGITQGDVILAGRQSLQFAVKEGKFNTAAIGPYITTALSVLAIDDENKITVEEILDNLPALGKAIKEHGDIYAEEKATEAILQILRPSQS